MQIIRISQEQLSFKLPCDLLATHQWHFSSKFHFSFSFYIVLVFKNIFFCFIQFRCNHFYFYFIMRPSSLGGGRIMRRTLSVRLSVCPSVPLSIPSVTSRHLANYNDTHVHFGTHRGPHIVRPSRPHKLV